MVVCGEPALRPYASRFTIYRYRLLQYSQGEFDTVLTSTVVLSSMHLPVKSRLENAPGNSQKSHSDMLSTSGSHNQEKPSVASWTPGRQPSWFHAGLFYRFGRKYPRRNPAKYNYCTIEHSVGGFLLNHNSPSRT